MQTSKCAVKSCVLTGCSSQKCFHSFSYTYIYFNYLIKDYLLIILNLDLVDNTSQTKLFLSNLGLSFKTVIIISDTDWPSWLLLLDLFLEGSSKLQRILVYTPSCMHSNMFGISRSKIVSWKKLRFHGTFTKAFLKIIGNQLAHASVLLFSGSLSGLTTVINTFLPVPLPTTTLFLCLVPGQLRLRHLRQFQSLHWQTVKHASVGGTTNIIAWLGSLHPFRSPKCPGPNYCPQVLSDIVEFAPKRLQVSLVTTTTSTPRARSTVPVPHPSLRNTWWSHGLLPWQAIHPSKAPTLPYVVTTTPFTKSGWCTRALTARELARCFDVPVAIENRMVHAFSTTLPPNHPLSWSFPGKLLAHSLWLGGIVECSEGGLNASLNASPFVPAFKVDHNSGQLVSQQQFNLATNVIAEKAVKMDDASVPVNLWNARLISHFPDTTFAQSLSINKVNWSLDVLRRWLLRRWWKNIFISFKTFMTNKWSSQMRFLVNGSSDGSEYGAGDFYKDLEAGLDCLHYATMSTWWEWPKGSRLFFWRWAPEFQTFARDGIPVCWLPGKLPQNKKPQPEVKDKMVKSQMTAKLDKVRQRGYVKEGHVKSLIRFFAVPKGLSDIRMVYDGTASGFNDSVWVPSFGLPTVETLLRGTGPETWMVDLDIADMFLNFMLDEKARELVGVDVSLFFGDGSEEEKRIKWERWLRCAMGLKNSPNHAIRAILFAEEFIKGNPNDSSNPFSYSRVELNLPGSRDYDPSVPWFRTMTSDNLLATLLAIYVDDERIHASSEEKAWLAAHQLATRESYLGIQDAARKRRPPSQNAGAWAGSIVKTNNKEVGVLVSEERWGKTRKLIRKWLDKLLKDPLHPLNTKELTSDRGFLVYVTRTYRPMVTYLKGMHLTIDGWRQDRDSDGWKRATYHVQRESLEGDINGSEGYPENVEPVPRLVSDLMALKELTEALHPPIVLVQSKKVMVVKYGFGDASGGGFGSSILGPDGLEVKLGTWNEQSHFTSSNFREMANFVMLLENEAELGKLDGVEIWLFTDNSTTEAAFHNGTTSSKTLFQLVLRMKKLELYCNTKIHLVHVAGTRMIAQGTDGLSRGNLLEGVMAGKAMKDFVPIHLSAIARSDKLLHWVRQWTMKDDLQVLDEKDWMWKGQGLGENMWRNRDGMSLPVREREDLFLWAPPPAVADVAVEFLRTSVHRRPNLYHVFICPKLMTHKWRKQLLKSCDLSFYVDVGVDHWEQSMHENLLIAIYLPLLHCFPWTYRRSKSILEMERQLRQVSKAKTWSQSSVLRKFFKLTRRIPTLQDGVVRSLLSKGQIR